MSCCKAAMASYTAVMSCYMAAMLCYMAAMGYYMANGVVLPQRAQRIHAKDAKGYLILERRQCLKLFFGNKMRVF